MKISIISKSIRRIMPLGSVVYLISTSTLWLGLEIPIWNLKMRGFMSSMNLKRIEEMIYLIRGERVMLDSDLAILYGVTTGNLNKAVNRNIERFPLDFMFELTKNEYDEIAKATPHHGGRRYLPHVFTENGVAMLSGVLTSQSAVEVNISIMRTFVKIRKILNSDETLSDRLSKIERGTNQLFKIVFERLDAIEDDVPALPAKRRKIGIKTTKA